MKTRLPANALYQRSPDCCNYGPDDFFTVSEDAMNLLEYYILYGVTGWRKHKNSLYLFHSCWWKHKFQNHSVSINDSFIFRFHNNTMLTNQNDKLLDVLLQANILTSSECRLVSAWTLPPPLWLSSAERICPWFSTYSSTLWCSLTSSTEAEM